MDHKGSHDKDDIASALIKRADSLRSDRRTTENVWQEIADYIFPNSQDFTTRRSEGEEKNIDLFDTTGVDSNKKLASALHSGLTSTSTRWFDLRPTDKELQDNDDVKRYISGVLDIMFAVFNSSDSNFSQQNHEFLLGQPSFGTSCMFIDEPSGVGIRFITRPISEILIADNSKGTTDTVFRIYSLTPRQALQEWEEEQLSKELITAASSKPDDKLPFIHAVMPRKDAERQFGKIDLPEIFKIVSFYIEKDTKHMVDMRGFHEMPYIVSRWEKLTGQLYGRSPSWDFLSDIKMANTIKETLIKAAQKQASPPLLMADDGVVLPLETFPDGVNIGGLSEDGRPLIAPLQTGARLDIGDKLLNDVREDIRRGFFVDQFVRKEGTPLSATEFAERKEDDLRLTGPQIFRVRAEYLSKVIDRVFNILNRAGLLPEAPDVLADTNIDVEYISPLVRNQRFDELTSINRTIESMGFLIEADPNILDNFNGDEIARGNAEIAGVTVQYMNSPDTVADIRAQRAEAQDQQQQQEQLLAGADAAANLQKSGIDITG